MTTEELLQSRGINKVLIIDDAYDEAPTAADLSQDEEAWSNFFDDLNGSPDDRQLIVEAHPQFEDSSASVLRMSDEFIQVVWHLRDRLSEQLWNPLFEQHEAGHNSDRAFLQSLEERLVALGLNCLRMRRTDDASQVPKDVSIVFADLFLGSLQDDDAMGRSVNTVVHLRRRLTSEAPLFVLMSRSTRLTQKKAEFRQRTGILGATFRVCEKSMLLADNSVERIVRLLAESQPDAVRLQRFLDAWETGLAAASSRFLGLMRSLDLPDYGLIGDLLLQHEGKGLGSYLLDVWDRVLQFEVEQESRTIEAAADLNQVKMDRAPAPHVLGSPELQEIVYRTVFHNPSRLRVDEPDRNSPVSFGDVLVGREAMERLGVCAKDAATTERTISNIASDVFVVVTPACDLARLKRDEADVKHVLVLPGTLSLLGSHRWTYKGGANPRLPILKVGDTPLRVDWKIKDARTIPGLLLRRWKESGSLVHIGRLRDVYALEVQQLVLSQLGRVGVMAPLPAKFSVQCEAGLIDGRGQYVPIDCPTLRSQGGEFYVGRDVDSAADGRLRIFEDACHELLTALCGLDASVVSSSAKDVLAYLQGDVFSTELVQRGLMAPPEQRKSIAIKATLVRQDKSAIVVVGVVMRAAAGLVDETRNFLLKQNKSSGLLVVTIVDDSDWK